MSFSTVGWLPVHLSRHLQPAALPRPLTKRASHRWHQRSSDHQRRRRLQLQQWRRGGDGNGGSRAAVPRVRGAGAGSKAGRARAGGKMEAEGCTASQKECGVSYRAASGQPGRMAAPTALAVEQAVQLVRGAPPAFPPLLPAALGAPAVAAAAAASASRSRRGKRRTGFRLACRGLNMPSGQPVCRLSSPYCRSRRWRGWQQQRLRW